MAKYVPIKGVVSPADITRFWTKTKKSGNGCIIWTAAKTAYPDKEYKKINPNSDGRYGLFYFNGRLVRAARFVLYMFSGEDPGESVDHWKCYNTLCVNPVHLRGGTIADNNATKGDVVATHCKNGHEKVEPNGYYDDKNHWLCYPCHRDADKRRYLKRYTAEKALQTHSSEMRDFAREPKLNEEIVKQIRLDYLGDIKSQRKLAIKYKISQPMVGFIVRNESWRDRNYIRGVGFINERI